MVGHVTQPDVSGPTSRSPNWLPHPGVVGAGWVTRGLGDGPRRVDGADLEVPAGD